MRTLIATAAAGLVLFTGCSGSVSVGKSVDQADVEKQVSSQLAAQVGEAPDDVSCPGDLKAKVGEKMTCTLTAGDDTVDVYVTVTTVDGDNVAFDIKVADQVNE